MDLLLERLVAQAARRASANGAMLFLPRPPRGALAVAPFGSMRGRDGVREVPEGSSIERALRTGERQVVASLADVPEHLRERARGVSAVAIEHLPVRASDGRLLGVLSLSYDVAGVFADPAVASAITDAIGAALESRSDEERAASAARAATLADARRFRAFMDAMPATAWIKDEQGRYLLMNALVERLWSVREADLLGKTDFDFLPRGVAEAIRANDATVRREGRPVDIEERVPTADGEQRTWLATKFPMPTPDGVAVAGVAFDVTPLKRAEEALARKEENLRNVLDGLVDGVIISQNGRVAYANRAAAAMFGAASPSAMIGVAGDDVLVEEERDELRSDTERAQAGEQVTATRRARRLDGSEFLVEAHGRRIDYQGGGAIAVILRDVTERRRHEERMRMASRLASLGTLAAAIGHEINNPLMFVTTNLELLDEQLRLLRPAMTAAKRAEIDEMVADAREGAARIRRIVRAMRALGLTVDQPAVIALDGAIANAVDLTANELRHRARVEIAVGPTPHVAADEARITQILVALLSNAAHAIEPGDASRHTVRLAAYTDDAGRAVLEVADDGAGIPASILPKVLDPFFTTKPVGAGTGLGLSITDAVVRALGGEVKVESQEGVGTTVRVVLPPSPPTAEAAAPVVFPAPTTSAQAVGKPGRILVIDDEPAIGRAVERTLRSVAEVIVVRSAGAGLDALAHGGFDLVLADVMMPEMDGAAFLETVERRFPEMARRIVFMTGGAFSEAARKVLADGKNLHVAKPLGILELKSLVAKLLAT